MRNIFYDCITTPVGGRFIVSFLRLHYTGLRSRARTASSYRCLLSCLFFFFFSFFVFPLESMIRLFCYLFSRAEKIELSKSPVIFSGEREFPRETSILRLLGRVPATARPLLAINRNLDGNGTLARSFEVAVAWEKVKHRNRDES